MIADNAQLKRHAAGLRIPDGGWRAGIWHRDNNIRIFHRRFFGQHCANVFAHFRDFDISDDLTLRVEPGLIPVATYASAGYPGAGIQMRLTF